MKRQFIKKAEITHAPQKPSNLLYGLEEKPPLLTTFLLGIQHVSLIFISVIFPVLIVSLLGNSIDPDSARSFISLSLIAGGITTMIQVIRKAGLGSGYFCPALSGPSYFEATTTAALGGGLPLVFGMTALSGLFEVLVSRILRKIRFLFSSEVTGVAVAMVGIVVIPLAIKNFFGYTPENPEIKPAVVVVALITLSSMVIMNAFTKGNLKLFCALIGMIIGYVAAYVLGLMTPDDFLKVKESDFFRIPYIRNLHYSFDFTLIIPFIIASICSTLKTIGDLATCQKINDANWKRIDMKPISGGILADGLGGLIPGLIGGYGQSTSSSNVGLSIATGVTSRRLAYSTGGILIVLGFLPKFAGVFLIMPKPVMGAALIFSVSFMIISGLQIIMSKMLDARKIFVVGISIIFGLSVNMVPGLYDNVHPWIKPIFSSALSLSTIIAIILNLIMRIGISKSFSIELPVAPGSSAKIYEFMENNGKAWGAIPKIIDNAKFALCELNEALMESSSARSPVRYVATFDELNIGIDAIYQGDLVIKPDSPSNDSATLNEKTFESLAMKLVYFHTDKVDLSKKGDTCHVHLHFNH
jgi:xanthine permease XanP